MTARKFRLLMGLVLLLVSLALLAWGFWPLADTVQSAPISPDDMRLPALDDFRTMAEWLLFFPGGRYVA